MVKFKDDDEILSIYLEETKENLTLLENGIIKLEGKGVTTDSDSVELLFRAAHSIKASSNLLEMKNIEKVSNELENILELSRSGKMLMNHQLVDGFLNGVDLIRELLEFRQIADDINIDSRILVLKQLIQKYYKKDTDTVTHD